MGVTQFFTIELVEGEDPVELTRADAERLHNDLGEALGIVTVNQFTPPPTHPSTMMPGHSVVEQPVIVGQSPGTIGGPSSPEMGMPESNVPAPSLEEEARALMAISAQYGGPTKTLEEWMESAEEARGIQIAPMAAPPPPEAHIHSQLGSGNDVGSARGGSDSQRSA